MLDINPLTPSSPVSNCCSLEALLVNGNHENERNDLLVTTSTTDTSLPQDSTSAIVANATFPSPIKVETIHPASSYGHEQKEATVSHTRNSTTRSTASNISPRNNSSSHAAAAPPPPEQKHNEHQKEEDQKKHSHPLYFEGKTLSFVRRPIRNSHSPCNDRTAAATTAAMVPPTAITVPASKSDTCSSNTGQVGVGQQSSSHHKPRVNSSYSISPLPIVTFNNHSTAIQNNYTLALSSQQKNPSLSSIADPMVLNNPIMNNNFQTIDFHFLNDNSGFTFPDYSMTMQQPIVNMMTSVDKGPVVPSDQQKMMSSTASPSLLLGGGERGGDSAAASEIPYQYPHLTSNAPTPSPFLDPKVPSSSHNVHCTNNNTVLMSDDSGSGGGGRKPRKDFQYRLEEIRKFQKKHGHSMIPHKYPMNPSLGTWVDTQRRRYRKLVQCKKKFYSENPQGTECELEGYIQSTGPHISQDHIDRLLEVGFVFEPRLSRSDTWERRVEELKRFKELQGHCNVKEDDRDFPGLGKWVSYVRRIYRLAKNKKMNGSKGKRLTDDRIDELRQMGFIFEFKEEMAMKRFKDGLQSLKEFKLKEGHCKVPSFYVDNPTFGLCVEDMRTEYKMICNQIANGGDGFTDVMSHEIVEELAKMGFLSEEGITPYPTKNGAGVTSPATVSE